MIHLDTSFIVRGLIPRTPEDVRLETWIRAREPLGIAAVAWAECLCGPVTPAQIAYAASVLGEPAVFDGQTAETAGILFNANGRRRGTMADCFIAATAIQSGASLATANAADFRRMVGAGLILA